MRGSQPHLVMLQEWDMRSAPCPWRIGDYEYVCPQDIVNAANDTGRPRGHSVIFLRSDVARLVSSCAYHSIVQGGSFARVSRPLWDSIILFCVGLIFVFVLI